MQIGDLAKFSVLFCVCSAAAVASKGCDCLNSFDPSTWHAAGEKSKIQA